MNAKWMIVPALLSLAACGGEGSGAPGKPAASGKPTASSSAKDAAGAAALANPEENYVAAATKIGCLGLTAENADGLAKERAAILKGHGYTDDSWKTASKQLGASKGEAIVKAMEGKCPD